MKTRILASCCLAVAVALLIAGCGPSSPGELAPMSGKLTLDGQPVPGVEIVFSPVGTEKNGNPGPYSYAVTEADGSYKLMTRYKEDGAVIGMHNVTMSYSDMEPGAMDALRQEFIEAKASGEEGATEVMERIEALKKKMKGRPMIPESAAGEYEVPPGGSNGANFELTSD